MLIVRSYWGSLRTMWRMSLKQPQLGVWVKKWMAGTKKVMEVDNVDRRLKMMFLFKNMGWFLLVSNRSVNVQGTKCLQIWWLLPNKKQNNMFFFFILTKWGSKTIFWDLVLQGTNSRTQRVFVLLFHFPSWIPGKAQKVTWFPSNFLPPSNPEWFHVSNVQGP